MYSLQLLNKKIILSKSNILFNNIISKNNLSSYFDIYNAQLWIENDWLTIKNAKEIAGIAFLKQEFPGNVLLEFESRTVLPSTHDINFMWNTEWSESKKSCGNGYVGSICGWWTQRVGIEKSPDFNLRATNPEFKFIPGKIYKVHAGSIDGTCFIFIDGKLYIELEDPNPLNSQKYSKVAFSAYSSIIQFRNIIVRQINWEQLERSYKPEF